jgi:hypothetical protein
MKFPLNDFDEFDRGLLLGAAALAVVLIAALAHCQSNPLPLGSVQSNGSASCQGFQAHSVCESLTISCPNSADINVIVATVSGTLGKTVFYANGSEWTLPGGAGYVNPLSKAGHTTVTAEFLTPWQSGPGNLLTAACRPATLFNYVANGSQFALIAASGGAGAAAYALNWYGASSFVSGLWITSGPVYSDLGQGCETPKAAWVTVTPNDGESWSSALNFEQGTQSLIGTFTGQTCEPKSATTSTEYTNWESQSILAPGAAFPSLYIYAQLCSNAPMPNNSSGQASLWLGPMNAWTVGISGCSGSEGTNVGWTPEGVNGTTALIADLEARF